MRSLNPILFFILGECFLKVHTQASSQTHSESSCSVLVKASKRSSRDTWKELKEDKKRDCTVSKCFPILLWGTLGDQLGVFWACARLPCQPLQASHTLTQSWTNRRRKRRQDGWIDAWQEELQEVFEKSRADKGQNAQRGQEKGKSVCACVCVWVSSQTAVWVIFSQFVVCVRAAGLPVSLHAGELWQRLKKTPRDCQRKKWNKKKCLCLNFSKKRQLYLTP